MQTIESIIEEAVARGVARALAEQPRPIAPTDGPPTLSVKQAAEMLGVSVPKMYDISHRADFDACLTVGRKRIIMRGKLLDWMERQAEYTKRAGEAAG